MMTRVAIIGTLSLSLCGLSATAQTAPEHGTVPIYRVTVVQRSVEAINYQYRSLPTKVDFRGTVLMPKAKGEATVESKRGRTEMDVKFDNVTDPQLFGREYLTYVLWAISPEGRPHNLGEVMPGSSDKAKLRITTDLQAFGLIVTAEPYSAVRQPSDVVVLENVVRPDTVGKFQPIQARFELMPRGHYTLESPGARQSPLANAPKVSMDQYEAMSELYQAQNALGIARSAGAEQYAPNTYAKAQQLVQEAQRLQEMKAGTSLVVQNAREAAQTAEDARVITDRRKQEEKLTRAQTDASAAQEAKERAEAEAIRAKGDAESARAQIETERAARQQAETEAAAARARAEKAAAPAPPVAPRPEQGQADRLKSQLRMQMLEQLNGAVSTRDTPRGLLATIPDTGFSGSALQGKFAIQVARIASIVAAHPGLRVEVDGNTDSAGTEALASSRAEAVRDVLLRNGLSSSTVSARGLGATRPVSSNRQENRRVEIVISGDPIGNLPFWDRAYTLSLR
jgi:outer membrane protein OmpA-like peptidoglycan-associated protein